MELATTFEVLRPSIVALASRLSVTRLGAQPVFPSIVGTGFVVDEDGLVATNRHVADALRRLPPNPKTGESSAMAIVWAATQDLSERERGLPLLFPGIHAVYPLDAFSSSSPFYGEPLPDLAFVQLKVRHLPPVVLDQEENTLRAGRRVATAGFPAGSDPLTVYGHLTQITPTLRQGIISAVYPFPCPRPHGFTIDVMTQGGASGSPVFLDDSPVVIGMIESVVRSAENITVVLPSHLLAWGLATFLEQGILETGDFPTVEDLLETSKPGDDLQWESYLVLKPKP